MIKRILFPVFVLVPLLAAAVIGNTLRQLVRFYHPLLRHAAVAPST